MRARYREDKATQAAARLLRHAGGRMSHLKLIKLLYLAERECLARLGSPLTYDAYASLPHGPVLSATLDRINQGQYYAGGYWDRHIAPKENHEVQLRDPEGVPGDQLSPAEEELIDAVFQRYGHLGRWELVELTHKLPEWEDPNGSALPIHPAAILRSEGYSDEEIADVLADWEEVALAQSLTS
ncbi:MAG TPA: Panacea domain-containing protein [Longimicrobium sp.]|jgi:uncharacterized phage-associated protein